MLISLDFQKLSPLDLNILKTGGKYIQIQDSQRL